MQNNIKKSKQLKMPFGTACNRLRKSILFHLLKKHKENFCYRCHKIINSSEELSIEHKKDWLDNDTNLFWDIKNIAFSHLKCNTANRRKPDIHHGTSHAYSKRGCRCKKCTKAVRIERAEQRKRWRKEGREKWW